MIGNGSYVNLLKLAWKNSKMNLFLVVFSHLEPLWDGRRKKIKKNEKHSQTIKTDEFYE
jgi:hypothetical protein